MYYLGIDIGSLSCDAVLIDGERNILSSHIVPTGPRNIEAIEKATRHVLNAAKIKESDLKAVVSTGYGRKRVQGRLSAVTEITCHAKGIRSVLADTRVLIDIGGQDSKAIALDKNGNVVDFAMNDKCAAGTGRFLEAMARALQTDIKKLADMDLGAKDNLVLSSMCTVFAESEVVSLIAKGVEINEIVAGMNRAIASRTLSLVKRVTGSTNGLSVAMSGGVARNNGVIRALNEILACEIAVPDEPDTIGALGAALIALERAG
jgi:predicted CoA-substrate-specific enzyme activase